MQISQEKCKAQISSNSDKVMFDRFDHDFQKGSEEVGILPEDHELIENAGKELMISSG